MLEAGTAGRRFREDRSPAVCVRGRCMERVHFFDKGIALAETLNRLSVRDLVLLCARSGQSLFEAQDVGHGVEGRKLADDPFGGSQGASD